MGIVLRSNKTSTPLSSSATYTGGWEDVSSYSSVTIACKSDVNGTLYVDFSPDGTNVDSTLTFDYAGGVPEQHRLTVLRQYFRARFVNNGTSQAYFRLQCIGGQQGIVSSPLNGTIQRDADAIVTRSYPEFLEVSTGKFLGISVNNKSGRNADIDSGTVPEFVWEAGGLYTGFPTGTAETMQVFSSDANDSLAGTGARSVTLFGLDADYNQQTITINLDGTTPVNSVATFSRLHSAFVSAAGTNETNIGTLTFRHTTTTANVFLTIEPGRNQSNAAVYTVPAGKRGVVTQIFIEVDRSASSNIFGYLYTRDLGAPPRYRRPFSASNTSAYDEKPFGGLVFNEKTDLGLVITSCSANNTGVVGGFDIVLVDDD